jgi:putative membrane protein
MKRVLAVTAVFVVGGSLCVAQDNANDRRGRGAEDQQGSVDQKFVRMAFLGGMMEVKMGQIAVDQASNPTVRKFAKRLVDGHSRANKELMSIIEKRGLAGPQGIDSQHHDLLNKFARMRGGDFDSQFMNHMVKHHEKNIALFEKEAQDGQDPDLKAFAAKTLPTLKEHLQMAKQIVERTGGALRTQDRDR